tara:strand:+ start:12 stop:563 length:552 start_codon:yes stop_codon:yes gene_type:complete
VVSSQLCKRIGCGQEAEAVLLMVPQECSAWLVSLNHPAAKDGSPLCSDHADRMTVPVGWVLSDERNTQKKRRRKGKAQGKAKKSPRMGSGQRSNSSDITDSIVDNIPVDDAPMPIDVSEVEELVSEPFEESYLQVVPESPIPESEIDEGVQGSFWDDTAPIEKLDPGEETPLLQRAFRVVSEE